MLHQNGYSLNSRWENHSSVICASPSKQALIEWFACYSEFEDDLPDNAGEPPEITLSMMDALKNLAENDGFSYRGPGGDHYINIEKCLVLIPDFMDNEEISFIKAWTIGWIHRLLTCDNQQFDVVFERFRKSLSLPQITANRYDIKYYTLTLENFLEIKEVFIERWSDLEEKITKCSNLSFYKWPHQTIYQAFIGHLFYPISLEWMYEVPTVINDRRYIQDLLAISSSFENTIAKHFLAEVLYDYVSILEDGLEDFDENKISSSANSELYSEIKQFKESLEEIKKEYESSSNIPLYFASFILYNDSHLKLGYEKGDVHCTERYLYFKQKVSEEKIEKLESMNKSRGLLLRQKNFRELNLTRSDRISLCKQAGKLGNPEGYNIAAILVDSNIKKLSYYLKAAYMGIYSRFEDVAELYSPATEMSIKMYLNLGDCGSEYGYKKAAEWTFKKSIEDAKKILENTDYEIDESGWVHSRNVDYSRRIKQLLTVANN